MITLKEKIDCLTRELAMRRRVYPRLINNERMTQAQADHETDVIASILEDYKQQIKDSTDDLPLFS